MVLKKAVLPKGFKACGMACGIKKSGKPDVALFYSDEPAKSSHQFTSNSIQAAPIKLSKEHIKKNKYFRAIMVNSGNANCFTGAQGYRDAKETAVSLARSLGIKPGAVLVSSTGIIGKRLPLEKIKAAIPALVKGLSVKGIDKAKQAIMTTDTFAKEITARFTIGGRTVTICGVAKGAGMIAPTMATMLCFILTDARITQRALDKALRVAVGNSFNCITVDGCMSTNDTVSVLANAASGCPLIDSGRHFAEFLQALKEVCLGLAKLIIRDAEGATKFIRITVDKAKSFAEAKKIALTIANSNLFKTAMFASSPNCIGRIVASVGASGAGVKQEQLKIKHSPLDKKEVDINVSIGRGSCRAVIYTSDLTYEYVKINAEYN